MLFSKTILHVNNCIGFFLSIPVPAQRSAGVCLREGTRRGVRALLEEALLISREMLRHAQLAQPKAQVTLPFLFFLLQLHFIV